MRNNKKISFLFRISLVLLFCVCFAIALGANAAIHGPNECCVLDHDLTDIDSDCIEGNVVAGKGCDTGVPVVVAPDVCNCVVDVCDCVLDLNPATCDDAGFECWCNLDDDGDNDLPCKRINGTPPFDNFSVTKNWGTCCIVDAIYNVTDWIFYVLLASIAIIFILAGFLFFAAGGDPYKIRQAQSFLLYGIIGLVLALLARIIPAIIKGIVS